MFIGVPYTIDGGPSSPARILADCELALPAPSPRAEQTRSSLNRPNRRRAVGVKRLDRLQAPCLPLLAFLFGPYDRLPVRRKNETGAGIGDFHPVAARLVDVEEKRLLDRML